ncbi:anthranilate synthase component I [Aerococcus agrisoli]|uniref:Anthranilate synthase component 1 n=1 Tax=Aerococcus agrisoli TaxID=2487350 RepID=A0A3N4FZL5_9LACT|nr:anthranilate synthase component I [Aerococcus agrisoli]RPA55538.1 anthranilate synthase component I [Aerococcus agrisoli]
MFNITAAEFDELKQGNEVFPVYLTVNADQLTPIGMFYNLEGEHKFLFESVISEKEIGRYSYLGANPYKSITSYGDDVTITSADHTEHLKGKVLDYVKAETLIPYATSNMPTPFVGGAIGYVGYDVIRQYESLPNVNPDELQTPESYLMFYKQFISYDHFQHKMTLVYNVFPDDSADYATVTATLQQLAEDMNQVKGIQPYQAATENPELSSNIDEATFSDMVEQAKEYIKAGDIFQVVLSHRLTIKSASEPFDIYRRLRSKNPSPYLFYIDFGDFHIIGSSPESLVTVQDGKVMTNPIAGTRKRGKDAAEDQQLKEELLSDEKERAEHVMLVDLGRNDIGRISEFGSVEVGKFMDVDLYSHVMHIVSEVTGTLKPELTCFDALSACLPVGTVSGAPKIRAMSIIDELENTKRGIYAGAVGYFSHNGDMNTCIAIRTIVLKDGNAYVQAGAGIVYDSNPQSEYTETLNKSMAMKEVI